ncbi:CaiB/BaiF CoA-transferase family protein [Deltaproteobacteria bacterium TL4]
MSTSPLNGLKILDFSTLLPGPYATMVLADLGADVLRIEAPGRPDLVRLLSNGSHEVLNRSKRCLSLNLKKPQALKIVKKLILEYDIVIEQFRPGVMKSLGLDYDTLNAINPELIYCSLTGYGQTGPLAQKAGHDINYMALSGLNSYSGTKAGGPPVLGFQLADVGSGSMFSLIGILSAVIQRQQTGEGQQIDISMHDGSIAYSTLQAVEWLEQGKNPDYESNLLNGGSYYNNYRTRDGRYLAVGSLEPKFYQQLLMGLDLVEEARSHSPQSVISLIRDRVATKTLAEWTRLFESLDACVEPVLTVEEVEKHPQVIARKMVIEVSSIENDRSYKQIAHPIKFSKAEPRYRFSGAAIGQHNQEVLGELGYSQEDIAELAKNGVFQ